MSRLLDAAAGVKNASEPVPGLIAGGQPTQADLAALKAAGVLAVIDMRDPMEPRPYRVPDAIAAAGLTYHSIPVPHDPHPGSDATLAAVRATVAKLLAHGPVFAHCASGNRTGAALVPYLMLDRGFTEDDAVNKALEMGTRSAGLLDWVMEYARKHQSASH